MCIHPSISFYILISNKSIDKGGEEGAELNINQEELLIEVKILNVFTFFGVAENFLVCGGKMTNYVNISRSIQIPTSWPLQKMLSSDHHDPLNK